MEEYVLKSKLKTVMAEKNLTISEVSEKAGLSIDTVKKILYKHCDPRMSTVIAIAEALDCSVDYLLGRNLSEEERKKVEELLNAYYKTRKR